MDYCSRLQLGRRQEILVDKPDSPVSERRQTDVLRMMTGNCAPANANLTSVQRQTKLIRNSLHWEEFFGSSLDLAPSLISLYDSLASENNLNSLDGNPVEIKNGPQNTNSSCQESLVADQVILNKCDTTESDSSMEAEGQGKNLLPECSDLDLSDCKKRPLSEGSGSSSSSISHHTVKKPNLCSTDPNLSTQGDIIYIDDESGNHSIDKENKSESTPEIVVSGVIANNILQEGPDACQLVISSEQSHGVLVDIEKRPSSENVFFIESSLSASDTLSIDNSTSVSKPQNSTTFPSSQSCPSISTPKTLSLVSVDTGSPSPAPSQGSSPPSEPKPLDSPTKYVTRIQRVSAEIVDTERTYVSSLDEIIKGYMNYLKGSTHLRLSAEDKESLFGNLEQIYKFSRHFLVELEECEDNAAQIAECFVRNNEGFSVYTEYCTNYPRF